MGPDDPLTRRQLLRAGAQGSAALTSAALLANPVIGRALASGGPACGRQNDIDHVVILIQENRSFDHYFGTYGGVRGFADTRVPHLHDGSGLNAFAQPGFTAPGYGGHLRPFHIDTVTGDLTAAFNFARPDASVPSLPRPSLLDSRVLLSNCLTAAPISLVTELSTSLDVLERTLVTPYAVPPPPQTQPAQEPGRAIKPSGPVACPA